jgi:putative salt-induced outer membrane protein YdiY
MTLVAPILLAFLSTGSEDPSPRSGIPTQDAPAPTFPQWSGALSLGATWTAGNTETSTVNGNFNAQRRGEKDRWTFDAYSNYGQSDPGSIVTSNNHGGGVKYDHFTTKKLYFYAQGQSKVDHVAELDLRYILGAGSGYQWVESEKTKWGTELGLSYVDEDFEDDTADADFVSARVGSILSHQISKSASFEQVAEAFQSLEDSEDAVARIDNRLKLNITGKWIAQIQYVLDFDSSTPNFVKESDHRVVLGLGWSFGG